MLLNHNRISDFAHAAISSDALLLILDLMDRLLAIPKLPMNLTAVAKVSPAARILSPAINELATTILGANVSMLGIKALPSE